MIIFQSWFDCYGIDDGGVEIYRYINLYLIIEPNDLTAVLVEFTYSVDFAHRAFKRQRGRRQKVTA